MNHTDDWKTRYDKKVLEYQTERDRLLLEVNTLVRSNSVLREKLTVALRQWGMSIDLVYEDRDDEECQAELTLLAETRS